MSLVEITMPVSTDVGAAVDRRRDRNRGRASCRRDLDPAHLPAGERLVGVVQLWLHVGLSSGSPACSGD
jgi:hypothetical protein